MTQEYKKKQVEEITTAFVKDVLANEDPAEKCFTVCLPLSLLLKSKKIKNSFMAGRFDGRPHYVLKADDEDVFFIDPTIKQFGDRYPDVFVGNLDVYKTFQPPDFSYIFNDWANPLKNGGIRYVPAINGLEETKMDLPAYLRITLRAASILTRKMNINNFDKQDNSIYVLQDYIVEIKNIMDANASSVEVAKYYRPESNLYHRLCELEFELGKLLH